ncbi:MAG: sulfatase-like hydrolase/transferase [Flavobacterium sp.]|jgi:arylsulfatase A-like enzyme/GH35 family endo-1,4-beta-xylanase|nr:sulfatase-like hydrolase/transferase [Flavobacterium sp.]
MKKYLLSILLLVSFHKVQAQNSSKPNILFIAIDDLKPTIGSYGDKLAITPNIDAIAKNGTTFLNNHTQQAVCGPSRASLLTGKRPDYTKVWDLKTKMRDMNPDILTIPQYFKQNGYETIGVGKIYDPRCVDNDRDKPSWSVPFIKERELNYPKGYKQPALGFYQKKKNLARIIEIKSEALEKNIQKSKINKYIRDRYKPPYEKGDVPDGAYVDGAIANKSLDLLDEIDTSKPFFLAVGFKRPHLPFVAPRKYWELYNESEIEIAPYQKKSKNAVDIAYHKAGEMQSYKTPEITYRLNNDGLLELDEKLQKKLIHGYYAATSYIDAQIGKIKDKLKQKGLDKNTIIVIWGDHGWHLGDHSLWNKHSNFEQATRSPLIIYDPRINKGFKITTPTEFVDLFPTLSDLANLEIPKNLDGLSLRRQLEGEATTSKIYAVSQFPRKNKMGYSFRTNDYRYTVWVNNKKSTEPIYKEDIHAEELYDYKKDPLETENKINNKKYEKTKSTFQLLAARYFKDHVVSSTTVLKMANKSVKVKTLKTNKRAQVISEFIIKTMKLSNIKAQFLLETLSEKYTNNISKTRGKNLSQEEKREIYKATFLETKNKLLTKFTKSEFDQINKLEQSKRKKSSNVLVGATLNYRELNTIKEKLFLKDFNYLTPANAAKQSRVHPNPTVWKWQQIDDFINFSKKHNIQVRLHGPISPQASKWAKQDYRTAEELEAIMIEFTTAFAKKFNNEPTVKWMDVVNETILPDGKWFGPKKGTNKWENPWLKIGLDENGFPLYILKSFEIATKHATNIKLVYNQNAGMQKTLWDKLKKTVLYLRSKGYRVDGIGWQAHIGLSSSTKALIENTDEELRKLSDLIDWAHENNLEFHVTELDYFIEDNNKLVEGRKKQAEFYKKLIETLNEKTKSGVVTLNLWDLGVRTKKGKEGAFHSIYDSEFNPTPAYKSIKLISKK